MVDTIKQNWNRIAKLFLTICFVQVINEYGKIIIDRNKISSQYIFFKPSLLNFLSPYLIKERQFGSKFLSRLCLYMFLERINYFMVNPLNYANRTDVFIAQMLTEQTFYMSHSLPYCDKIIFNISCRNQLCYFYNQYRYFREESLYSL
jgi:hypothetical protein